MPLNLNSTNAPVPGYFGRLRADWARRHPSLDPAAWYPVIVGELYGVAAPPNHVWLVRREGPLPVPVWAFDFVERGDAWETPCNG
jgi:hypothetical protein